MHAAKNTGNFATDRTTENPGKDSYQKTYPNILYSMPKIRITYLTPGERGRGERRGGLARRRQRPRWEAVAAAGGDDRAEGGRGDDAGKEDGAASTPTRAFATRRQQLGPGAGGGGEGDRGRGGGGRRRMIYLFVYRDYISI